MKVGHYRRFRDYYCHSVNCALLVMLVIGGSRFRSSGKFVTPVSLSALKL